MARGDRILSVARARVIIPASGGVWTAAAIAHAAHVGPLEVAFASAAAAALARTTRARPVSGVLAATGAWATAATAFGPLAGPHAVTSLALGAGTLATLWWAHRHPSVKEAKDWRAARLEHLATAHKFGLHGSHLVHHERTRLGEIRELDVTGTQKLASQLASGSLAERIAQEEGLPPSRVQVSRGRIAGRVRIAIRYTDPWKHPVPHPLFDDDPETELPLPCTVTQPLPVGLDPETGKPLTLTLWDEDGAKVILVVAKRRGGKTVLLSCARERITAAEDADLWNINLSKSVEDREWAEACEYSACGPHAYKQACQILQRARQLIDSRGATPRDTPVFQPTPGDRLKVLVIDEIDALVAMGGPWVKEQLAYIASKAGSEGVTLIIAGQRATAAWMGGANVRANIEYVAVGKVRDAGEVQHAAGQMGVMLPDMSSYGEGHPGVWVIAETGGDYQVGRTFNLRELTDIRKIAARRSQRVPEPVAAGNLPASNLLAGSHSPGDGPPEDPAHTAPGAREPASSSPGGGTPPGDEEALRHMDAQLGDPVQDLPDDLREKLARIDARNADTRRILDETNRMPPPVDVDPEARARSTAERWRQVGEQAVIPDGVRDHLLALLAGEGTTIRKAAEALGSKPWPVRCWLEKLRQDGIAEIAGKGRGARWRLVTSTESDDG